MIVISRSKLFIVLLSCVLFTALLIGYIGLQINSTENQQTIGNLIQSLAVSIEPKGPIQLKIQQSQVFTANTSEQIIPLTYTWMIEKSSVNITATNGTDYLLSTCFNQAVFKFLSDRLDFCWLYLAVNSSTSSNEATVTIQNINIPSDNVSNYEGPSGQSNQQPQIQNQNYYSTTIYNNIASTVSYVIQTDGLGLCTAIEGSTGQTKLQSTNASYVIQSIVNSLQTLGTEGGQYGGKIHLKSGIYNLTTGIIINCQFAGITIEGEGGATMLIYQGTDAAIKLTNDTERNVLEDFQIHLPNNNTFGVEVYQGQKNTIDNLIIRGDSNDDQNVGIEIAGESHWNHINNVYIQNLQTCIAFNKTTEGYPHFNSITNSQLRDTSFGLIIGAQNIGVSDTAIEQFTINGIRILGNTGSYASFVNMYLESSKLGDVGIYIEEGAGGICWQDGPIICDNGTTVIDNGIGKNQWIGPGWENSGYVELANGGSWNHSLLGIPTTIQLEPLTACKLPIITSVAGRNATAIIAALYYGNGTQITTPIAVYWEAKYQP